MTDATLGFSDFFQTLITTAAQRGFEAEVNPQGELTLTIDSTQWLAFASELRDNELFQFAQLIDVCGVDYQTYGHAQWITREATDRGFDRGVAKDVPDKQQTHFWPKRFAVVYHLLSLTHNQRVRVRVFATGEPPSVPSVINIWPAANWFEREAFDLFGILFEGHEDLRRLLTDYGFIGHPFRKDFPLSGEVEVRFDEAQGRVVNQPVSIPERILVPRVIRHDNRYVEPPVSAGDKTHG